MVKENKTNRGRKPKTTDYNSVFAQRFRNLIKEANITLPELAEKIGATRQSIGQWKDGNTIPNILILKRIAEYFNVSSDYLIGIDDCKDKEKTDISIETGLSEKSIERLQKIKKSRSTAIVLIELIINNNGILESWIDLLNYFKPPESDIRLIVENYINNIGCGLEEFSQDSFKKHLADSDYLVSDKDFKILFSFVQNYLKLCDIANADVIEGVQLTTNQDIGALIYYLNNSFSNLVNDYINQRLKGMENSTLQQENYFSDTPFYITDLYDDTQTMIKVLENCMNENKTTLQTLKAKEAQKTDTKSNSNKEGGI